MNYLNEYYNLQLPLRSHTNDIDRQIELDRYINDPCIISTIGNIALSAQEIDGLGNN